MLTINNKKIAPAICYESLQPSHSVNVFNTGAEIYVASVAKSANGVIKVFNHFPKIAKRYSMFVLMSNCLGQCDDFECVGNSAIWNKDGLLLVQLNKNEEGIFIFDTETEQIILSKNIN